MFKIPGRHSHAWLRTFIWEFSKNNLEINWNIGTKLVGVYLTFAFAND